MTTLKTALSIARDRLSKIRRQLTGGWKTLAESPVPAEEVDRQPRQASLPSWGFFFMLVLSSAIATLGFSPTAPRRSTAQ